MALPPVNPEGPVGEADPAAHGAPGRGLRPIVAPLAWAGLVLALSRVDVCVRTVPVFGVLRGPAGVLLLALAFALALAAVLPPPRRIPGSPRLLFGLAWLFLVVVGLSYTLRLRVSGDEPPYL